MPRCYSPLASLRPRPIGVILLALSAIVRCEGQNNPDSPARNIDTFNGAAAMTSTVAGYESRGGTSLFVDVFSENGKNRLDRQALVKLNNQTLHSVSWQTTNDTSEAAFGDLAFGHYDLEVSALGYLPNRKEFQVVSVLVPIHLEITLQKDPSAVQLNFEDGVMPPKARKETKHGVSALKSGRWDEANKRLDAAYKLVPENPDINFLLGYLYFEKKNFDRAADFLDNATNLSPHNVQALTLLGRLRLQQEDYGRAVSNLEKAVSADSDYWVAHDLLAASYLQQRQYDKAREQAELAISKGKQNATASQLVLGQALVNLGHTEEGIRILKDFVTASPRNPSVPQVKVLIAQLEAPSVPSSGGAASSSMTVPPITSVDPMIAAAEPTFSVRPWQPPAIDTNRPSVATDVRCPDNLVEMAGNRAEELVTDVSRIAAIEHLLHEQLDEMGDPLTKESRTFNYVASFEQSTQGWIAVQEYRQEHLGLRNDLRRTGRTAGSIHMVGSFQTARRSSGTNA